MTRPSGLFRQEALEFHAGQPRPGGALRIDPLWTRWSYWLVLASIVAGVIVAATAQISETTSGLARIDVGKRTFVALVPDAAAADLQPGQLVRLDVQGLDGAPLAAETRKAEVADQAGIRDAGFSPSSQPAVLVTGVIAPQADVASLPSAPPQEGRAVVVLGSRRLLDLVLGQLRGTLGKGGDR